MKSASLFVILLAALPAFAQPPAPPAPEKYKVKLRYYIPAPRDPHVAQYDAMISYLQKVGFEFDPPLEKHADTDREDRTKNYLTGFISSKNKLRLLDPLIVQSALLMPFAPDEFKLPEDGDAPITVRLELSGNLPADRQRELQNQVRVLLRELGFKEPAGYDHRGYSRRPYTRIVGTIPKGKLDLLNRDLRKQPAGWLGPMIKLSEIPLPLADFNPVQVIEVLPDGEAIKELPEPELRGIEDNEKISPDLWELVKRKDVPAGRVRVQVGFVGAGSERDLAWKVTLQELTPGFFIEGQNGPYVTGVIRLDQVKTLALSPLVNYIRLPRAPNVAVDPAIQIKKGDNAKALEQSGLQELHRRGYLGKGVRLAIIDRDFRGWEDLVKKKLLPVKTRLVDLTTEADPEIFPQPYLNLDAIGHGTLCAQAAALPAPAAELVLIRVDVVDPYQLHDVLRYVQGGNPSNTLELRNGELMARAAQLQARRALLLQERRLILNDFTDETDERDALAFLGPVYAWLYSDRDWHRMRMDYHAKLEEEHRQRENRYRQHLKAVESLAGIPIVVNAFSWQSGFPLGSASPLSRALDILPSPQGGRGAGGEGDTTPLWFQAAGNTRGQSWFGPYRGVAGDPALKFVADTIKLPKGRWSEEVNFLAWQPHLGEAAPALPARTTLRLTMQWREPHDPDYFLVPGGEDLYRRPLANMSIQLLKQRDSETKKLPADLFELIARTGGWPQRIEHLPNGSVYEHVLEAPIPEAGRYAIRIEKQVSTLWLFMPHPERKTPIYRLLEGLTPTGIRPLGAPTLPALEKDWDLRPRVFVEVLDEANRVKGRAVFGDFPMDAGSVGIPMDSRNVISVGAASLKNQPQPYSAFGSPSGMELARRPWLYAYDELELAGGGAYGTSIANAFAAGTTAAMLSGNLTRDDLVRMLRGQEGQVLRVPVGKK